MSRYTALLTIAVLLAAGLILLFTHRPKMSHHSTQAVSPASPALPVPTQTATATSETQIYRNVENGFTLQFPSTFKIEEDPSADSQYKTNFRFSTGTSTIPLALQVTDLTKYLPLTTTPTLPEYLQTLSALEQFKKETIGGKDAYEYLICGRAACSQEITFIHNGKQYQFSVEYRAFFPNEQINGNVNPRSISFESAPLYIRQIIESLQFLPAI